MSMDMHEYEALLQQLKNKYAKESITKTYKKVQQKSAKAKQLKPKTFKPR